MLGPERRELVELTQDVAPRRALCLLSSVCCTNALLRLLIARQLMRLLHPTLQIQWMTPCAGRARPYSPFWTRWDVAASSLPPSWNPLREPKEATRKAFDPRGLGIQPHLLWSIPAHDNAGWTLLLTSARADE